jgi:hypothetical protein
MNKITIVFLFLCGLLYSGQLIIKEQYVPDHIEYNLRSNTITHYNNEPYLVDDEPFLAHIYLLPQE